MEYTVSKLKEAKEVGISGTFTFRDHDKFFEVVSLIKEMPEKALSFNLSKCEFIDSAALGMFVIASDEAAERGISLSIKMAAGKVKDVMAAARFDKLYKFEE